MQEDCLFRLKVLHFKEKRHWFLFSFHHIIMDGWCLSIVFHDLINFYEDLSRGVKFEELESEIDSDKRDICSYQAYINWLNKKDKQKALAYWKALLADYRDNADITPLLKPDSVWHEQMELVEVKLSKEITDKLKVHAKNFRITLNVFAEAAWGILLMKYNYTNDVVYGKVVSGRNVPLQGIHEKVGLFINAVPLRVCCNEEETIEDLCLALKEQEIKGSSYDFCPLSEIQTLTEQGFGLIKTLFVYENYYAGGLSSEDQSRLPIEFDFSREQTSYPISISFSMGKNQLEFKIMYNPNTYISDEVEKYAGWLEKILVYMALYPKARVCEVDMITEPEKKCITEKFNKKAVLPDTGFSVIQLFEEQVKQTPHNIALVYNNEKITYEDLNKKSNRISGLLKQKNVQKGDYVGVLTNRSINTIAALYGILKAGGAYVPIDPTYPEERIRYILKDCKPKLIVVDTLPGLPDNQDMNYPSMDYLYEDYPYLDLSCKETLEGSMENPDIGLTPQDLAYCIYTSGTTGRPKGVMVEHKGIVNLKNYFTNVLHITETDSILQFANLVFDASVWEMTMALLTGAKLVIPTEEERKNNRKFLELAERECISVATLPPNFYANLEGFHPRMLVTAGSETTGDLVKKGSEAGEYINAYGPTEFTVAATYWEYEKGSPIPERIPIGKPILNTEIYILSGLNLCGIGVPGELCMTGVGLARGYLNKPELTKEKFIKNPYGDSLLYRSGDLARWLPDGNLEYLGRQDEQVKIRGYRIELGEIESLLRKLDNISDAAIIARKDRAGDNVIYAYIVSEDTRRADKVKEELRKLLPDYMIPSYVIRLEAIPVNKSGKVDKKALPDAETKIEKVYVPPQNEEELKISRIFSDVLKIDHISTDESFFDAGGDSLKAMRLAAKLTAAGFEASVQDIFYFKDIKSLTKNCCKTYEITDCRGDDQNIPSLVSMEDIKNYIKKAEDGFMAGIIREKAAESYSLSPMQKLSLAKGILKSGIVINIPHEINIEKLAAVIKELVNSQELLRCTLAECGEKYELKIKPSVAFAEIPAFDISPAPASVQTEFKEYIKTAMFEKQNWEVEKSKEKLLYFLMAVRYGADDWKLYIPVSHLIFDGMSSEILKNGIIRNYFNRESEGYEEKEREKTGSFFDYVKELKEGPMGISEEEIIKEFNLKQFQNCLMQVDIGSGYRYANVAMTLCNTRLLALTEKQMWNICYKLFKKLLIYNTGSAENSFGVLYADRNKKKKSFYNTIGEFLDIVPFHDALNTEVDYDFFNKIINKTAEHNLNFTSFIYDVDLRESFKDLDAVFADIGRGKAILPVYNFSGLFNGDNYTDAVNTLHEKEVVNFVVDITYQKQEIRINGFCIEGEKSRVQEELQIYLEELLAEYNTSMSLYA